MSETLSVSDFRNLERVRVQTKVSNSKEKSVARPHRRRTVASFQWNYAHWNGRFNWDELLDGEARFIPEDEGGSYPALPSVAALNGLERGLNVVTKKVNLDGRKGTIIQATKLEESTNVG